MESINKLVQEYQKELNNGDLGKTYKFLLSFIMKVRGELCCCPDTDYGILSIHQR